MIEKFNLRRPRIYSPQFKYLVAHSIEEGISFLRHYGDEARPLAGAQSLIPLMKFRLAQPKVLLDINRIPGLGKLEVIDGKLSIGALVRYVEVMKSPLISIEPPILTSPMRQLGDVQVRNWGTAGGSMGEADPGGDWPAVAVALDAQIICTGVSGWRVVKAREFFVDSFMSALKPDELITEVLLPIPTPGSASSYL